MIELKYDLYTQGTASKSMHKFYVISWIRDLFCTLLDHCCQSHQTCSYFLFYFHIQKYAGTV